MTDPHTSPHREDLLALAELEAAEATCERLLKLAHDAPLNEYHLDANGHRWVEMKSYAFAKRGSEWVKACEQRDKIKADIDARTGGSSHGR